MGGKGGAEYLEKKRMKKDNKPSKNKKCIWCLELKSYSDFDKYDKSSDGYRSMCYSCMKIKKGNKNG
jgi:hypothetical protein